VRSQGGNVRAGGLCQLSFYFSPVGRWAILAL
jgi:hypothetical protein